MLGALLSGQVAGTMVHTGLYPVPGSDGFLGTALLTTLEEDFENQAVEKVVGWLYLYPASK